MGALFLMAVSAASQSTVRSTTLTLPLPRGSSCRSVPAGQQAGEAVVTSSVGAYQLEGLGVHLFEHIDGDHFTILGLPLLPLLGFLRDQSQLVF